MPVIGERVSVTVRKLLFATDFTESSEKASAYARALAHRYCATVELAHVFDPSAVDSYEAAMIGLPSSERRRMSRANLEKLRDEFIVAEIETKVLQPEGHRPSTHLLKLAKEEDVDLIVVGTTAKSGLVRMVMGSTAEQLIRSANCPVLTIGPNAEPPGDTTLDLRTIVFATDLTPESAKAAAYALSFAEDSGAHLFVCHVLGESATTQQELTYLYGAFESILRRMIPESSYDWCSPECVVEQGNVAEEVLRLAAKVKADLIVVGARKASTWLTRTDPGVIPAIWASATCPVLSVC